MELINFLLWYMRQIDRRVHGESGPGEEEDEEEKRNGAVA